MPASFSEPSKQVLARVSSLHPNYIDLSLARVYRLAAALGHPHRHLPPVVHVAGTNGKGSTLSFIQAGLEQAGLSVHRYTSPHLVRFHERIVLAGQAIEEDYLADLLRFVVKKNAELPITFFELTTCAAFLAFSQSPAACLLLETGLGGRLDATNIVETPILTLLTPISLDHKEFLGSSLRRIAREKAGILKRAVPLVSGPQDPGVNLFLQKKAQKIGTEGSFFGRDWTFRRTGLGLWVEEPKQHLALALPYPGLRGLHQHENASLATLALHRLRRSFPEVTDQAIARGLVRAFWPGRLQRLRAFEQGCQLTPDIALRPRDTPIWLDGAHNSGAVLQLVASFKAAFAAFAASERSEGSASKRLTLIFAALGHKDAPGMIRELAPLTARAFCVGIPGHAGLSFTPEQLVELWQAEGVPAVAVADWAEALARSRGTVLICGSLYLAGAVLKALEERAPLAHFS